MDTKKYALIRVHIGYFCMGLTAALVKGVTWSPVSLVFARMLIAGVLLFMVSKLRPNGHALQRKDAPKIGISTVLFAIHWLTFFAAIKVADVPTAAVTVSIIPVFSALFEPLLHKHKPSGTDVILACCTFAAALIIIEDFSLQNGASIGLLLGFVSAATKSLRDILSRQLSQTYGSLQIMSYQMLVGALLLLPFFRPATLEWSTTNVAGTLIIAIVGTAIAHTLTTSGFRTLKAVTVNLLGLLTLLYQIGFGILLVHNIPTVRMIIGGSIIIAISALETKRHSQST